MPCLSRPVRAVAMVVLVGATIGLAACRSAQPPGRPVDAGDHISHSPEENE